MAAIDDVRALRDRMDEGFTALRDRMDEGFTDLREELAASREAFAVHVTEDRLRLGALEQRMGPLPKDDATPSGDGGRVKVSFALPKRMPRWLPYLLVVGGYGAVRDGAPLAMRMAQEAASSQGLVVEAAP